MRIDLGPGAAVRSFTLKDVEPLARHANHRDIWRNLRDAFPHPYTQADALLFLDMALGKDPETLFALEVDGEAAGSIGFTVQPDVERVSAELGYWLGRGHWGRGITTAAVREVTRHAVERHRLTRVFATPYAHNQASCRVLEKAGYQQETLLRRSAIKEGRVIDKWLYAYVAPEPR